MCMQTMCIFYQQKTVHANYTLMATVAKANCYYPDLSRSSVIY